MKIETLKKHTNELKLSFMEKFGFGSMAMVDGIASQFIGTFLLFFLTDVSGITPAIAGMVMSAGLVWDAINDPLIGYFADNHRFKNGEKARPFALICAVPTGIMLILMFTLFDFPPTARIVYAFVTYILLDSCLTFLQIPSTAMRTLATDDPHERVSINTFASLGANIGTVVATLFVWPLIELFGGMTADGEIINQQRGFFWVVVILAVLIVGGALTHYFTTRERVRPINPDTSRIPIKKILAMLFATKSWTFNMLFLLFSNIHNGFISITVVYLAISVLQDSGAVTLIMATYLGGAVLALPFIKIMHKKLGRRRSMIATTVMLVVTKVYFLFSAPTLLSVMSVALFVGIGVSINLVLTNTTGSEVADLVEFRRGRRIEVTLSTLTTLILRLALALVAFTVGMALEFSGYNSELTVQPASAINAILAFFGWIPTAAAVVMCVIAYFFPIEKEMEELRLARAGVSNEESTAVTDEEIPEDNE